MAEVEKAVKRPHWEPRHEWESRVKFVEDNMTDHGLEKAVSLSVVWSNMKFMGCSYPPGTERLVKHYPLPPFEELKARRRAKESLKRELGEDDCSPASHKRIKVDDNISDVSSLISSIRSQSERNQQGGGFFLEYDAKLSKKVPRILQTISNATCLCEQCLGNKSETEKVTQMFHDYAASKDGAFKFDFEEDTSPQEYGYKCVLVVNGESIVEKVTSKQDESKMAVCVEVLNMVNDWQEAHGKPACPNLAQGSSSQSQSAEQYWSESPSRYAHGHNEGNKYNGGRGNHYSQPSPSEQRSRYNSRDCFFPPQQNAGRRGRGYGGRGNGGYQYGGQRY